MVAQKVQVVPAGPDNDERRNISDIDPSFEGGNVQVLTFNVHYRDSRLLR
jgi:hypothetical protein